MRIEGLALARAAVDRVAHRRLDPAWLAAAWADPDTRVLVVDHGKVLVRDGGGLVLLPPAQAPPGERLLLGEAAGVAYFAVAGPLPTVAGDGVRTGGLRELGPTLDDRDAGLLVQAVALTNWHSTHPRCARCGEPTEVVQAGYVRRCPADASEHFPRTDPAVIMAVIDDADRILLGRQPSWPERRYSTLAGFVEPGEALEAAVRREVLEEVGVRVGDVTYAGSQPWPFPSSLMVGFFAQATTTEIVLEDEICEAWWWLRGDLRAAIAARELLVPPTISISRRLIEGWYGGPLAD